MAESTIIRTKRDVIIAYTDGSNTYTVAYEPGDLSADFPLETINNYLDRGVMPTTPSIRKGDDQPMTFTHTAHLRDAVSAAHATLLDLAVRFASGYVATNYTSTIGTSSDEFTFTLNVTVEGSNFGGSDVTLTWAFCSIRASIAEGDPSTVSINGTSYKLRPTFA